MSDASSNSTTTIVDNTDDGVLFWVNPQYVNVSDIISTEAYNAVQALQKSAYKQTFADITSPKWSFYHEFNGTRVTVIGAAISYITGPLPAAQYMVDGQSLSVSTVPNSTRALIDVTFYESDFFAYGTHTLTVNVTTATQDEPYLFDYLIVSNATTAESETTSSTTTAASSGSSSSLTATRSTSQTSTPSAEPDVATLASGSKTHTGAIVGGAVGGLALLAAVVGVAWFLWRRNRRYHGSSSYAYAQTGQYDGPEDAIRTYTLQPECEPVSYPRYSGYSDSHPGPSSGDATSHRASTSQDAQSLHDASQQAAMSSLHSRNDSATPSFYSGAKAAEVVAARNSQSQAGPSAAVIDRAPAAGNVEAEQGNAERAEGRTDLSVPTSIPPPYSP